MITKLSAAAVSIALAAGLVATATPAHAAATPSRIDSVRAVAGPGAGEVTFSWSTAGKNTTSFQIETGLNTFGQPGVGPRGRGSKIFTVAKNKRSLTLSADQLASAGASVGSGNHLYYRFRARNGSAMKAYPYLQAVMPKAQSVSASAGAPLRVGSFNVRTARATADSRAWLLRAPDIARQIRDEGAGIYALQELGPGRADGLTGTTNGTARQTDSLLTALRSVGAGQYRLNRSTPVVKPGVQHNTQGARVLYDASRYTMLSRCVEKTGTRNWSNTCAIELPIMGSDNESVRRSATYARFQDKQTGQRFWFASVHLDQRHSANRSVEAGYNALRGRQIKAVNDKLTKLNTASDEVIIAGDINSWQNNKVGHLPHDYLVGQGFLDTAAAEKKVNLQYSTMNDFKRVQTAGYAGFGSRIDVIMVKGAKGAERFENVTDAVDSDRPSDHNMIVTDIVL